MKKKNAAAVAGIALLAWHCASFLADAERYKRNLARYNAVPSMPNFVKLLIAEGVLIGDLGWL